ncbi:hypothetical protein [Proteus terrae]|uniref:hypothetical protein n=1 Tax=Proteus terrae TaxID=1574161 RepID=UPI00288C3351|nr:hypothetical protein [Proteus terrae]
MSDIKDRIKQAFELAGVFASLKKEVERNIDKISGYLTEITGGKISFFYKNVNIANYEANNGVFIKHVDDKINANTIFIFAYSIDDVKAYPVLIEDDDDRSYFYTEEELNEELVRRITDDETMSLIYKLINKVDEEKEDIPF